MFGTSKKKALVGKAKSFCCTCEFKIINMFEKYLLLDHNIYIVFYLKNLDGAASFVKNPSRAKLRDFIYLIDLYWFN